LIHQVLALPEQILSIAGGLFRVPSIFVAGYIADTWAGYPYDQDTLLSWCWQHGITGVVVVSGDTHIGTLEDGTMGGLPELMTGGAGKTEKRSYRLARLLGIVTFNRGGQGISSKDFRPAFGLIDFYSDSAHVRLLNARGRVLAEMRCRAQDSVLPPPLWERLQVPNIGLMFELTPKAPYIYKLRWRMPRRMPQVLTFRLYDGQGKIVWEAPSAPAAYWRQQKQLSLPNFLQGCFFLRAEASGAYYGVRLHMP
ncbi:MAG: hypothetical protein NZ580_04700, partial [Bacteroidia bacterium]|nr:hypothetical protein [Bacteroidia bacterium]